LLRIVFEMTYNKIRQLLHSLKKFPVVQQHDISDCGPACLSSIVMYYGGSISIARLRELSGTGREGTSGLGLVKALENFGFIAKGFKSGALIDINVFPFIAQIITEKRQVHFVVVYKVYNNVITYMDPGKGLVKSSIEDFKKIWTKNYISVVPGKTLNIEKFNNKALFSLIGTIIKELRLRFALIVFISLFLTSLGILSSFYMQYLFDTVLGKGIYKQLTAVSLFFVFIFILQLVLGFVRSNMITKLALKIDKKIMLDYFRHVLKLPMSFFISRKDGEIISRFMDASRIREAISGMTLTLSIDTLIAIAGGILLYFKNSSLFYLTLIIVLLYSITVFIFNRPLRNINKLEMESNAALTSHLVESLNGIETLKAFNSLEKTGSIAEDKFDVLIKRTYKGSVLYTTLASITSGITSLGTILILWFGIIEVISGKMTTGELLAFNSLLQYFLSPVNNLIDLSSDIQSAIAASNRLGEILEIKTEMDSNPSDMNFKPSLSGDIEINNITFRYGHNRPLFKDFSLKIKAGEKIAIKGESGSGKTTLARLIMNYYSPEAGEILISSVNIKEISLEYLRSRIAFIPQDIFIISGTIRENISLGCKDATMEEVIEAARQAKCNDFIEKMYHKYDTVLEENGANLSGGQRQRLAIARAFLMKPDIIIMDEATSNLDPSTEEAIGKTLKSFDKNVTQIIIAHRESTIKMCDRVFDVSEM